MMTKVTDETLKDWVMSGAPIPEKDEQPDEEIGKKKRIEQISTERKRIEQELRKLDEEQEKLMSDPKLEQAVSELPDEVR